MLQVFRRLRRIHTMDAETAVAIAALQVWLHGIATQLYVSGNQRLCRLVQRARDAAQSLTGLLVFYYQPCRSQVEVTALREKYAAAGVLV